MTTVWNGATWDFTDWLHDVGLGVSIDNGTLNNISSFGEDNLGNLFIVDHDGEVFQISAVPLPGAWLLLGSGLLLISQRRSHHQGTSVSI